MKNIRVWDLPTRLFHWLLVLAYAGVFYTSYSEWLLEYHTAAGYTALGLVIFRILWGFAGNRYARFSGFIKGWREVKTFLKETIKLNPPRHLGHNPAVGWAVMFMLLATAVITTTGIIVFSGEENRGLWAGVFIFQTAEYARSIHIYLAYGMVVMIVGHICAALFHDFILRENIILSMITGTKEDNESWSERVSHFHYGEGRSLARLLVLILVTILGGIGLVYLPPQGGTDFSKMKPPKVIDEKGFAVSVEINNTWKDECASSCHSAFYPSLLPARSWEKILSRQADHYGDNVTLDENSRKEILNFLLKSSAEHSTTESSKKMLYSIHANEVPDKVTDVPYWKYKHNGIGEDVYKRKAIMSKSNCIACHPGAEVGSFEDEDIKIPE
ncbi:MAG: cytochrome b/b6 domain-containing protein [Nitrospirae bacterium]|nr:cytochrome b/b6 domain-containing protein [Nitrospirota bacterium]